MATISSSETFKKQCTIFLSARKTVNIQGYSKLREPIKMRKNCYPLIWQILNSIIHHLNNWDQMHYWKIWDCFLLSNSNPKLCKFKGKLLSSTFQWYVNLLKTKEGFFY